MARMRRLDGGGSSPGRDGETVLKKAAGALLAMGAVILLCASLVAAAGPPALQGRVNDYAGLLSDGAKRRLDSRLADLERTDSTQIAILTVDSLGGDSLEDYSVRAAQAWGIGQKGKDNGALLLVARKERAVRIEVGYGLEWRLTDIMAGRIVDEVIVPRFKQGRFDEGVTEGVEAMVSAVRGEYKSDAKGDGDGRGAGREEGGGLVAAIIAMVFFASLFRGLPGPVRGIIGAVGLPALGALFSAGALLTLLFVPLGFLLGVLLPFLFGRGGGRRGGGMFHGGGFGGGFGGFGGSGGGFSGGGGGFGGGGASGRW